MQATVGDTTLAYEVHGSGIPLLTLHGGLGFDHTYLRPWLDRLGARFEVIYFDQRAQGRSPEVSLEGATLATFADDAVGLAKALGHDEIVLFGHSYGAFIALETVLRHPDRVRALVLSSASPVIDYPEAIMAAAQAKNAPEALQVFAAQFGRPVGTDEELKKAFAAIAPLYFHRYDAARASAMIERMQFRASAYNASAALLPTYNVLPRLHEIRVPTLILQGRHDFLMPVDRAGERLRDGIAGSKLVLLEQSGHFAFVEENALFTDAVLGFANAL